MVDNQPDFSKPLSKHHDELNRLILKNLSNDFQLDLFKKPPDKLTLLIQKNKNG